MKNMLTQFVTKSEFSQIAKGPAVSYSMIHTSSIMSLRHHFGILRTSDIYDEFIKDKLHYFHACGIVSIIRQHWVPDIQSIWKVIFHVTLSLL